MIDGYSVNTKGTVTDDTGLPLPGANIMIKGTSIGTQTDFDGEYEIETKPGDVLVFSYVGFDSKEITVSNVTNIIDVSLDKGDFLLGEVVVGGISWISSEDVRTKIQIGMKKQKRPIETPSNSEN